MHITKTFLVTNDKNIYKVSRNQGKKFHKNFHNNSHHNSITSYDPDKVNFIFSCHVLKATEKSLPSKELNFAKASYRDVDSFEVSNLDKEFIKSSLRGSAFLSYKDTGKNFPKKLPKANLMH